MVPAGARLAARQRRAGAVGHLLARVLEPLHRGEPVQFRPPAWARHGRQGAIEVPAGLDLVIVEGTGGSQREVAALVDTAIWVQADFTEAERRGIERDVMEGVNGDRSRRSRSGATGWGPSCASSMSSGRGNEPT